ncbi:hypothetical protein [Fervidibacillus halotolerans]|uniref:Uncharacterized protein n=1 Tax=Fervidibacillus halotolerans TaxID=2980027 RepID=A0A9E8RYN2_9BACI|nr:hypothetical protein [Fervidibacillus halotolerans]WAA12438.1 hypothetical protein OE105_12990 [Fervidibacillus halotolerans]
MPQRILIDPSVIPDFRYVGDLYLRMFVGKWEQFIEYCQSGQQPISNGRDNVQTMDLYDQILSVL